jgi:hypothetical protein
MLFKKKLGKQDAKISSIVDLVADHSGTKAIVFGLQWRSVATTGGLESAEKMARAAKATHYVYRGQQIGFGTIPGKVKDLPVHIYPASLLAAKQHVGDSLYIVRIDDAGSYWIALIRNGSPTSTDRFVTGLDDAGALAMARGIFEPLEADNIKLGIFTNIERSGIDGARLTSVEELLSVAIMEDDRLQVVPRGGFKVPKPVLGVVAFAILFLVFQRGYGVWEDAQRAKLAAKNAVVDEDPVVAWNRAIANWSNSVTGHNPVGLTSVRDSMADLPIKWDGWILIRSNCLKQNTAPAATPDAATPDAATPDAATPDAATPDAATSATPPTPQTLWSCSASYERQKGGSLTREMNTKVPDRWKVTFTPLDSMQLTWEVLTNRDAMVIEELPKKEHHTIETVSKLQRLSPSLAGGVSFTFAPVDIPAPVSQTSGAAFPVDQRVVGISSANLIARGPLRSIDALINAGLDVAWNSIALTYTPSGSQANIQSSVIAAEAVGVMYAKN